MRFEIERYFSQYIKKSELDIELSYSMPDGYEDAFGTFDITCKTLFFNAKVLESKPLYEALYYFYHELRHAEQYLYPQRFDEFIQRSTDYVVLYNGACFKLIEGKWVGCQLSGDQEFFTLAYENLPYELEANRFAHDTVKALLPEYDTEIESLYRSWLPKKTMSKGELEAIFSRIDQAVQ